MHVQLSSRTEKAMQLQTTSCGGKCRKTEKTAWSLFPPSFCFSDNSGFTCSFDFHEADGLSTLRLSAVQPPLIPCGGHSPPVKGPATLFHPKSVLPALKLHLVFATDSWTSCLDLLFADISEKFACLYDQKVDKVLWSFCGKNLGGFQLKSLKHLVGFQLHQYGIWANR